MRKNATFRELIVWQKAIELAKEVYRRTQRMPGSERFGLTAQMRRTVVSVASNVAEGNARRGRTEYLRFLAIARGSLAELETQLLIARDLEMMACPESLMESIHEIRRMLQALIQSLRNSSQPQA